MFIFVINAMNANKNRKQYTKQRNRPKR